MKTVRKNYLEKLKLKLKTLFIRNRPSSKSDWIRLAVLLIAIPVLIYSSSKLISQIYIYIVEDNKNTEIIELKPTPVKNPFDDIKEEDIIKDEITKELPYTIVEGDDSSLNEFGRFAEYQKLWERNNEMVGWIYFPGVARRDINYPILQGVDNIFYLNYDFDKNRSHSGSIFMDTRNKAYFDSPLDIERNYLITGHAMKNFSMFGSISDYWKNENSWENAKYIYLDLMNTRLKYEVVSSFAADPQFNYKQLSFADDDEYLTYITDLLSQSNHDFGISLGKNDKIITLETCYLSSKRTITVGRLVNQIIYKKSDLQNPDVTQIVLPTDMPLNEPSPTPTPLPEDVEAAKLVSSKINELPDNDKITLDNKQDIIDIREMYNSLSISQKTLVSNLGKLSNAELKILTIEMSLTPKPTVPATATPTKALNPTAEPTANTTTEPTAEPTVEPTASPTAELTQEISPTLTSSPTPP